jgi:hypothetical protein
LMMMMMMMMTMMMMMMMMMIGKVKHFQAPLLETFSIRTFYGRFDKRGCGVYFCKCPVVDLFVVGLLFSRL